LSRSVLGAAGRLLFALVILLWLGAACASSPTPTPAVSRPLSTGEATPPSSSAPAEPDPGAVASTSSIAPPPARQGSVANSARVRFVPLQVELPSGRSAAVEPEQTVNGVLQIPADIQHVGWWDGSAEAGDPFGSTVIAGHVDSREQGLGFFAELLLMQVGDLITLRSDAADLSYRVVSATLINKDALASDNQALDQHGPHRLVLVTCSGQFHPDVRSYDSNLILVAEPVTG
jgi:LPXTG-site transpeptidase (sortase) family protein